MYVNIRPSITILCMFLLCFSLFPLRQDASPPVVSIDILNYSISKFVTSVEFVKAPYSSTLIRLRGCFSLFSVIRMNCMMQTCALLNAVVNTHSILVFAQMTVSMEVKPRIEVTL